MNASSKILPLLASALCLTACDSTKESHERMADLIEDSNEASLDDLDTDADVDQIAALTLSTGATLTFTNPGDDSILLSLDTPEDAAGLVEFLMKTYSPTPLELFLHFSPEDADVPDVLWRNHEAEVEALGLEDDTPRTLLVPRTTLPNSGTLNYNCNTSAWASDWSSSFGHRDVDASLFASSQNMANVTKRYYSGSGNVQRVNWGVCSRDLIEQPNNYTAGVQFRIFKRNGAFNYGCGGAGWTAVGGWHGVTQGKVKVRYYYAGATADKTCIALTKELLGVGDTQIRSFGVGVAYDHGIGGFGG